MFRHQKHNWLAIIGICVLSMACWPTNLHGQNDVFERFGEIVTPGRFVLRWGMQKGQKFLVEAVQETVTEIESPLGKSGRMPATLTVHQEWEVLESDEQSLTLLQTFLDLQLETTLVGAGKVSADTKAPEPESPIAKQMHANLSELVGRQLKLHANRLGQVSKFEFVEPAVTEAPKNQQFLTKENLKNAVGQMVQFPKATRAVGETWGTTIKSPQPNGTAEVSTEYTLLEILPNQPRWLKIGVAPKLTLTIKDEAMVVEEQSSEGHIVYDDELALVRETFLKQAFVFVVKSDEGGKRRIESTMRMKIEPVGAQESSPTETTGENKEAGPVSLESGK
ncbi:MAG: hypothetical protein JNL67_15345 [Planctomycetaceae bacterium]|nr:hypothetical protein [Planctomycetaceae bacterium]